MNSKVLKIYKYKEFEIRLIKRDKKEFHQVFLDGELYSPMHFETPKGAMRPINAVSKIKDNQEIIELFK